MIPYGRQWLDDDDFAAVADVLRSDHLTTGPLVERFEAALCELTGCTAAAVVNSGTAALHAGYAALGLGKGDRIVTSPLTFAATANAALYLGAEVTFADVSDDTGNLDPAAAEAAIDERTRLLVAVDYAGHPADYPALRRVASKRGLSLVADAAHSLGATLNGTQVGKLADLTTTSFHPVKPITTAEGGAVLSDDTALIARARRFRTHGIVREQASMQRDEGPWYYEMQELGWNYRLTDLQCALGVSQMRKLAGFLQRRRQIAVRYDEALRDCATLRLPTQRSGASSGYHLYVVRVQGDATKRRPFFERLRARGLGVQVHYLPVYLHPYYERLGYRAGLCPVAEDFYARAVSLPMFPKMSDAEIDRVIEVVREVADEILG